MENWRVGDLESWEDRVGELNRWGIYIWRFEEMERWRVGDGECGRWRDVEVEHWGVGLLER